MSPNAETNRALSGKRQMVASEKNKGGRPPRGPISGKSSTLATRITPETRRALDEEAVRTGRSVSQVVEIWLDEAKKGRAEYLQRMGGSAARAAVFEKLLAIAQAIDQEVADKELRTVALRSGLTRAISELFPERIIVKDRLAAWDRASKAWDACLRVLEALDGAEMTDPVRKRALEPLMEPGGAVSSRLIDKRLADVLKKPSAVNPLLGIGSPDQDVKVALDSLRSAGPTARAEIDLALKLVNDVISRETVAQARIRDAASIGESIADAIIRATE